MPMKLTTTIGKIQSIPNAKNIEIVQEFLDYMKRNGSSEHHQNNNLKVVIAFANYLGEESSFYDIKVKEQVYKIDGLTKILIRKHIIHFIYATPN